MPLYKVRFPPGALTQAKSIADLLAELASPHALAVTLFETGPGRFVVEAYYGAPPRLADLTHAASLPKAMPAPVLEAVPDQDWLALSQAALPPVAAGRFLVHGHHDRDRARPQRMAIEIEAGAAFGTGHNATTTLCLEAIDRLVRRRRFRSVLDLGCGTGVLAIAAARAIPAARVLAVDNDPLAVAIARTNARLNAAGRRVHVIAASDFAHPQLRRPRGFDLVLANLLPGPLIALVPAMRRGLRPGGIAVLSGVLDHQARELTATYRAAGFVLAARGRRAGWTVLTLERMADGRR
ncbi:MAG: 50S ribosomal protein L11 methyltransferase [Hyphomicrobiaceae bacterium]|nr:50S ribosomal protein L11 methyltransferase [Hyphomicrobiaceae bacterium]